MLPIRYTYALQEGNFPFDIVVEAFCTDRYNVKATCQNKEVMSKVYL